jgi:uncharacterized iron-regulated membrane protein
MLIPNQLPASKPKKSTFRRVSQWLHLWLGLFSGIIVFIVCFTGGIRVFRYETWYFTEKYQRVTPQEKAFLAPSELITKSKIFTQAKS